MAVEEFGNILGPRDDVPNPFAGQLQEGGMLLPVSLLPQILGVGTVAAGVETEQSIVGHL